MRKKRWFVLAGAVGAIVVLLTTTDDLAVSPSVRVELTPQTARASGTAQEVSAAIPSGVVLQPIDGGANFYTSHGFTKAAPLDNPAFFPIGIWYPSLNSSSDVATYQSLDINMMDRPDQPCNLSLLAGTGIYAIPQYGECGGATGSGIGNESVGLFTDDEVDGNYVVPAGYTYLQSIINGVPASFKAGRFFWSNYGADVLIWLSQAEAAQYVNDYQQTVSADLYWFTIPDVNEYCSHFFLVRCSAEKSHRGSNYGSAVDTIRSLESPVGSEPIWAFVEDGYPAPHRPGITPARMNWAIWSSIIHGARGIIYFNHSFGGPSESDNNFEDPYYTTSGITPQAKATDALIKSLAPVLNDDTALHYVAASPAPTTFGGIETMAKYHNGQFTIFADTRGASGRRGRHIRATFHLADTAATSVTVVNENRTIGVVNGTFTDTFASAATVHIYQVNG